MSYPNVLVNFRIPVALKNEFEDACNRLHMPMTAVQRQDLWDIFVELIEEDFWFIVTFME